jgi:peptide-methionine (R)-S-oxide reductase
MKRREILHALLATGAWAALPRAGRAAPPRDMHGVAALQRDWKQLLAAEVQAPAPTDPLKLSEDEWRKRLDLKQYYVLREEGTEAAGSSPLNAEKRPGVFCCAGCGLPLFTSAMKYDSGTGWPSFFTTIAGVFATKTDYKIIFRRTEYHCVRCGGHHGHVFDDGPQPTGKRWCNNGVALKFIPKSGNA